MPFPINFTSKSNFVINLADGSAFFYVLDGQTVATSGIRFTQLQNIVGTDLGGQANLTGIAPGFHTITVYYVGNVRTNSPQNDYMYATSSVKSATSVFFIESETPAPTPTLSPSPSASPSPTLSPTPLPTISATAAMTPTETQQPTSSPNPTVPTPSISGTPPIINIFIGVAALVIFTAVAAGVLLYLKKRQ